MDKRDWHHSDYLSTSQHPSPTSPEVISPVGLAILPAISPLRPSPVDLDRDLDIPEAQHPLPESLPPSPSSIYEPLVEESTKNRFESMEEPCDSSTDVSGVKQENGSFPAPPINQDATNKHWDVCPKHSAPSSPRSFVTSVQELNDELSHEIEIGKPFYLQWERFANYIFFLDLEASRKLSSPSPTFLPVLEGSKVDHDGDLPPVGSPCHLDKIDGGYGPEQRGKEEGITVPLLGVSSDISIASTSASDGIGDISGGGGSGDSGGSGGSLSSLSLSCLQCRVCRREMPDDITATMCGHVFCNR